MNLEISLMDNGNRDIGAEYMYCKLVAIGRSLAKFILPREVLIFIL
jgi:hypothetical protein